MDVCNHRVAVAMLHTGDVLVTSRQSNRSTACHRHRRHFAIGYTPGPSAQPTISTALSIVLMMRNRAASTSGPAPTPSGPAGPDAVRINEYAAAVNGGSAQVPLSQWSTHATDCIGLRSHDSRTCCPLCRPRRPSSPSVRDAEDDRAHERVVIDIAKMSSLT